MFNDLISFQTNIAKRWLSKGKASEDTFAKFFFYFSGFNALYFLEAVIDDLKDDKGKRVSEVKQIAHLLRKFDESTAKEILKALSQAVNYFSKRPPIQRMDKRTAKNPHRGDDQEGSNLQKMLRKEGASSIDRLVALGKFLYLVRCNLVHGSKTESGDDKEIISNAILPLEIILAKALSLTSDKG